MSMPHRPARPTDRLVWRDKLIAELDRTARTSTGSLQFMVQKMHSLVGNSKPGDILDKQLFMDLQEAFGRYAADPASAATPAVIMECMEWLDVCFMAPMAAANGGTAAKRSPSASSGPVESKARRGDGFDSGTGSRARLPADGPADPSPQKQQQELESIKNWMMNPGVGKVKG